MGAEGAGEAVPCGDRGPGLTVRPATSDDAEACWRLGQEAFGGPDIPPDPFPEPTGPGKTTYVGTIGRAVVAKAADRPFESWYGGRTVPTSGIAGVAVLPEARGHGVARAVLRETLAAARARGALVAALYPSAPGIYRGLGFGHAGAFTRVEVPLAALGAVRPEPGITLERLAPGDGSGWAELVACYDAWAREHDGPLTRTGAAFEDLVELLDSHRVTLARDEAGAVVGFAAWRRHDGYLVGGGLDVEELVATTAAGARALLALCGTHAATCRSAVLLGAAEDLLPWHLPSTGWRVIDRRPYLITLLDVAGALAARGYDPEVCVTAAFAVTGSALGAQDGAYRVTVTGGAATVERSEGGSAAAPDGGAGDALPRLDAQGLGMLYAGAPAVAVRRAGHLNGPDGGVTGLARAMGGRTFAIRDYF